MVRCPQAVASSSQHERVSMLVLMGTVNAGLAAPVRVPVLLHEAI
jgi:hypothetical protein